MATNHRRKPSYQDFLKSLSELEKTVSEQGISTFPRLVVVYGSSEYLTGEALRRLKKLWQKEEERPYDSLEAVDVEAETLCRLWEQSTLFDPATLYVIRRVDQVRTFDKNLQALAKLDGLDNAVILDHGTATVRAPLQKELTRLGAYMIPCMEPWPNEFPRLVTSMAAQYGLQLDPRAADLLIESVGSDLVKMNNEINKLFLIHAERKGNVTAAAIAPHLGMLREDHAFELDRLLLGQKWAKAQALVTDLVARGEEPIAIVGLLARHCRNSIKVKKESARSSTPRDLAFRIKLPLTVAQDYSAYVNRRPAKVFQDGLTMCQQADQALKSSSMNRELILARIIDTIAQPGTTELKGSQIHRR